ncbi:MAG: hypothetical protein HYW51_03975 [Candidatus Doudnabacteria bacterium]|nr:hypothetical protein [Candidatus Doudnabacteria bacterium]
MACDVMNRRPDPPEAVRRGAALINADRRQGKQVFDETGQLLPAYLVA